jgi:Flp pilus assembly protein TadD/peroxiredoxin
MSRVRKTFNSSRRDFLKTIGWTPTLSLLAPFHPSHFSLHLNHHEPFALADSVLTPHYPAKSPLAELLRQLMPGADEYMSEKYAYEIMDLLADWSVALRSSARATEPIAKLLGPSVTASPPAPSQVIPVRANGPIQVRRNQFSSPLAMPRDRFLQEMEARIAEFTKLETAEFLVIGMDQTADDLSPTSSRFTVDIRYDLVGSRPDSTGEERIGNWRTQWSRDESGKWRILKWHALGETIAQVRGPAFLDVTSHALGNTDSYRSQILHGAEYWRTVLDGACGIDVYGNNGVAVGDYDNDGFDDLYVSQPAGLPNRLYRNRGDGTLEDVTDSAGVGVLDATACALFADFQNRGLQDLLVVCSSGPMLFLNQGNGKFKRKPDAFKFAQPPQGTFTHAALADYDGDGRIDIYFCLYSYYLGLDQYHYPAPYFDARNGPPNFLLHNEGDATFLDRTQAAGLSAENDRYSFACAWGDVNANGHPDLYVANDFGRNNLYRNNGDGTFTAISAEANIQDVGAGMSACWLDFDNDGRQDVYVSNMWSPAGLRVSHQAQFHNKASDELRALYRQHARGNSLYHNLGDGKFKNVSAEAGVDIGRWAWSSDSWDFDQDGYPDLYCANGYISGPDTRDLSSFFWRHVVAESPADASPSPAYERGWNAINEQIRSDMSWSGYERNTGYLNNHDGTFSDVAGVLGLDAPEDSRAFALADIDHDGRLEIILKNRSAPQLRILRNALHDIGHSVSFRLRGEKSNRDAIGAAITVETDGLRQTKYLQAGSGFLSQHTKELFFGLGTSESLRAVVRWPSGAQQAFDHIPANHRIEIHEGSANFQATPFAPSPPAYARAGVKPAPEALAKTVETWLVEPLSAPGFSLPDSAGNTRTLQSFQGSPLLLCFWKADSPDSKNQLGLLQKQQSALAAAGLHIAATSVDDPPDAHNIQSLAANNHLSLPILLAAPEVAGVYNIIYRYLFDRRRDLPIPTSFLIDENTKIVKLYQGVIDPTRMIEDVRSLPRSTQERIHKALPFDGLAPDGGFHRNDFTYGVAMFQHGYLDQAEESFKQVIAAKPRNAEAHYNLGTLYLRRKSFAEAHASLQQAVNLRPDYPEAWNNLGMLAAEDGHNEDAVRNFRHSLELRPDYAVAMLNLGNLYRRQGDYDEARTLLLHALDTEPQNAEIHYSLGMLYARQDQLPTALQYLDMAVRLRPDYNDALNNLGVLLIREKRYPEAEDRLKTCVQVAPDFDQAYLNLARLYVLLNQEGKAREILQELLRRQPQHTMARQALEMLH